MPCERSELKKHSSSKKIQLPNLKYRYASLQFSDGPKGRGYDVIQAICNLCFPERGDDDNIFPTPKLYSPNRALMTLIAFDGFTDTLLIRNPKCKCGPLERPELPDNAKTDPLSTNSPVFTTISLR